MMRRLLPLAVFVAIALALALGLRRDPRMLPSPLVGKPAPAFELATLDGTGRVVRSADLHGQVWLFNVWASWCGPCEAEHPALSALAGRAAVPVIGLDYKDQPAAARAWLQRLGNPYAATVADPQGQTGIAYGVYGVPETFVIDRAGVVRFRHAGALTNEVIDQHVLPLLRELQDEGGRRG
jgi:cytochrome c biogenesis protein CcmG/thiol:disulfide interchange protein DsbE